MGSNYRLPEPYGNKPKKSTKTPPKKGIITKCYYQCEVCKRYFPMAKFWAERLDESRRITCGLWRCTDRMKPGN